MRVAAAADGRDRPFRGPCRQAHHIAHDGDDVGVPQHDLGGVVERYPKLRVVFLEPGGG